MFLNQKTDYTKSQAHPLQSDEKASIAETENADFEKETDAALMVAQASAFEKVPGTANYELGQSDIVDDAQEANLFRSPRLGR